MLTICNSHSSVKMVVALWLVWICLWYSEVFLHDRWKRPKPRKRHNLRVYAALEHSAACRFLCLSVSRLTDIEKCFVWKQLQQCHFLITIINLTTIYNPFVLYCSPQRMLIQRTWPYHIEPGPIQAKNQRPTDRMKIRDENKKKKFKMSEKNKTTSKETIQLKWPVCL